VVVRDDYRRRAVAEGLGKDLAGVHEDQCHLVVRFD
jgi:hypothetical protein